MSYNLFIEIYNSDFWSLNIQFTDLKTEKAESTHGDHSGFVLLSNIFNDRH